MTVDFKGALRDAGIPTTEADLRKAWEKDHQPNLTGTALAYAPSGSIKSGTPVARRDYEAWTPE